MFKNFITPFLPDFVKFIIDEYEKYDDKVNFCDYFVSKLEMDTISDQSEVLGLNDDRFVRDSLRNILKESKIDHQKEVFKETNWKNAHIYCKIHRLTSQQFGPILQNFIIHRYGFLKKSAKLREGDCTKNNLNIEVKVSLGSKDNKYHYVQIRLSHDIQFYLLSAYLLNEENVENEGELFIFNVPKEFMKFLVKKYGGYAHGTIKEYGKIEGELDESKEYAIRPEVGSDCWNFLLNYRINESELVDYSYKN